MVSLMLSFVLLVVAPHVAAVDSCQNDEVCASSVDADVNSNLQIGISDKANVPDGLDEGEGNSNGSAESLLAYDQSLQHCKAVASEFGNTCAHGDYDTPASSMDTMSSQTVECADNRRCIAAGVLSGTTCTWQRKLCVTCRDDNGVTKIRLQSNNLPDHCVSPGNNLVKAKNFDYEVIFNRKQTHGEYVQSFATQDELNSAVCPIAKQYNKRDLGIVEYGDVESRNVAGFAINGVAFQFANQIGEDPVSPITMTNEQPLDLCLGHNQQNSDSGMYHYHHLTPCLIANFLDGKTMSECAANDDCKQDTSSWSRSGYDNSKYKKVVGLSKFGHVMYGPYDDAGNLWAPDEVDACNGAWSNGDYFYVGTAWHPYLVGCQGPANLPQENDMFAQCSNNGMGKYATTTTTTPTTTPTTTTTERARRGNRQRRR